MNSNFITTTVSTDSLHPVIDKNRYRDLQLLKRGRKESEGSRASHVHTNNKNNNNTETTNLAQRNSRESKQATRKTLCDQSGASTYM